MLNVTLTAFRPVAIHHSVLTHNLNLMAEGAGLYGYLWRPEELGITKASQLIEPLTQGLEKLRGNGDYFRQFNNEDGFGRYEDLVAFVSEYLAACEANPDADVLATRQ